MGNEDTIKIILEEVKRLNNHITTLQNKVDDHHEETHEMFSKITARITETYTRLEEWQKHIENEIKNIRARQEEIKSVVDKIKGALMLASGIMASAGIGMLILKII